MMKKNDNIHANHRKRMREKILTNGFTGYQPHEVLEQMLFTVRPRINTNLIGHELINKFGSVMNVLDAKPEDLVTVEGVGEKSAEYIGSIKPKITEKILTQYREIDDINEYNLAFLADWFMRKEPDLSVGVITFAGDGKFADFLVVDCGEADNAEDLCDAIAEKHSGRLIAVYKSKNAMKQSGYTFLKEKCGDRLEAYYLDGKKPVSV